MDSSKQYQTEPTGSSSIVVQMPSPGEQVMQPPPYSDGADSYKVNNNETHLETFSFNEKSIRHGFIRKVYGKLNSRCYLQAWTQWMTSLVNY